jgi:hypothetical protein
MKSSIITILNLMKFQNAYIRKRKIYFVLLAELFFIILFSFIFFFYYNENRVGIDEISTAAMQLSSKDFDIFWIMLCGLFIVITFTLSYSLFSFNLKDGKMNTLYLSLGINKNEYIHFKFISTFILSFAIIFILSISTLFIPHVFPKAFELSIIPRRVILLYAILLLNVFSFTFIMGLLTKYTNTIPIVFFCFFAYLSIYPPISLINSIVQMNSFWVLTIAATLIVDIIIILISRIVIIYRDFNF